MAHGCWTEFRLAAMLLALAIPAVAALTPSPAGSDAAPVGPYHGLAMAAGAGASLGACGVSARFTSILPLPVAEPVVGPQRVDDSQDPDQLLNGVLVADRLPATLWQVLAWGV